MTKALLIIGGLAIAAIGYLLYEIAGAMADYEKQARYGYRNSSFE